MDCLWSPVRLQASPLRKAPLRRFSPVSGFVAVLVVVKGSGNTGPRTWCSSAGATDVGDLPAPRPLCAEEAAGGW